ncbi:MAG: hypothetical protein HN736_08590 [Anaerolineae bacterium]|jgi:methanogenic corrinoid protein MtbC1|nr:hypothetical protein [Anaerolineae bacterium]MBT4309748.1 hypothetical protein [Anaerolineae bacterium]MBT4457969.1 hypothetical protein [Anaerolineae bacterium]MBT4841355.1 hypothetical protein [Anaerolineae bacterium]MBT6062459.1 hypothetical protein [Anaerolineae bacterium]
MTVKMQEKLAQVVADGDSEKAKIFALKVVKEGLDLPTCITGAREGLQRAGRLHASGEYLLADLFNSTDAMKIALGILEKASN